MSDPVDFEALIDAAKRLVGALDPEPDREGLIDTPRRMAHAWAEWTSGYDVDIERLLLSFEDGADNYDQMVIVRDIPVYSTCEHHLAPFLGRAHVAYVPHNRIVGLSKLARLVDAFSRRLQVQERITTQVADALYDSVVAPKGVGVILRCRHMCMESRGARVPGSETVTSAVRGVLLEKPAAA